MDGMKEDKEKKRKRTIKLDVNSSSTSGDVKADVKRLKSDTVKVKYFISNAIYRLSLCGTPIRM